MVFHMHIDKKKMGIFWSNVIFKIQQNWLHPKNNRKTKYKSFIQLSESSSYIDMTHTWPNAYPILTYKINLRILINYYIYILS